MNKSMATLKTSRKLHKWFMLFVGVQFVIWSVTGAYMVFFDIDYIHGDSLVNNHQTKIEPNKIQYLLDDLLRDYPQAEQIEVGTLINLNVYRFSYAGQRMLIDAASGQVLSPIDERWAKKAARHYYTGSGEIQQIELISQDPPFELSPRALPAWRVNFADFGAPSIYVSAVSGELVGKRHEFWRLFDWMFRFHVMDYEDGDEIDNLLLFWVTLAGILACIFGLILTYFRVFKPESKEIDAAFEPNQETSTNGGSKA
jgi:Cu(I)/Ag(I) efflux system membrane protein CusA/SilA|tara:strand:- start:16554 stop:17321 length:768 start_codon:yes stop_codon:yes gene_type:complete